MVLCYIYLFLSIFNTFLPSRLESFLYRQVLVISMRENRAQQHQVKDVRLVCESVTVFLVKRPLFGGEK